MVVVEILVMVCRCQERLWLRRLCSVGLGLRMLRLSRVILLELVLYLNMNPPIGDSKCGYWCGVVLRAYGHWVNQK